MKTTSRMFPYWCMVFELEILHCRLARSLCEGDFALHVQVIDGLCIHLERITLLKVATCTYQRHGGTGMETAVCPYKVHGGEFCCTEEPKVVLSHSEGPQ